MARHERAGQTAQIQDLVHLPTLMAAYYVQEPDSNQEQELVRFGTSGHRGSSLNKSFNEMHILAICQAICLYRQEQGIEGPILVGKDTHALSEAAYITALEVFIANGLDVHVQQGLGYTPTPVISHEVLRYNRQHQQQADGVVITPSHNPPQDGGIKYNPPHGGPAGDQVTAVIEKYANAILSSQLASVMVVDYEEVLASESLIQCDWIQSYVNDLATVVDMKAIQQADLRLGVHAMGGAGIEYWHAIASTYQLNIDILYDYVDPQFAFMTLDKDGAIRMDCSSKDAMASLLQLKDKYDLGLGNDPDYDRHGIVTPEGLMNPNHYLAVCIDYLHKTRPWMASKKTGKTLVSSAIIDRVVQGNQGQLYEVPVGFKWFAEGMYQGQVGFAGEESAGASFLDHQGAPFSTDKDGLILALLAAEILATTKMNPQRYYHELEQKYGRSYYQRLDIAANPKEIASFQRITRQPPHLSELAGEKVTAFVHQAPGNKASIGGLKVSTANGWFAVRPSGTEPIYKIYAESLSSDEHLKLLLKEAQMLVQQWLA